MSVVTYEGIVENGKVHLPSEVELPEKAAVYVVVPEVIVQLEKPPPVIHVRSPRLKDPAMAVRFKLEVSLEHEEL